jgi:hypothetical protein
MELVFELPLSQKAKLSALLEADPYGKPSFTRNGYKLKEGLQVSQDKEKAYLFIKCTDDFVSFAREKLKEIVADGNPVVAESKPEVAAAVAKAIADEENSAEVGFGAIFG